MTQTAEEHSGLKQTGAVLVVGGGIAGIQASLDLAESGQKVVLVEKSPAIGGNMARLDKTFPTNDCSMCILSPKVVECGRHLNIDLITLGEVEALDGEPGNFQAKLHRRARYVDLEKCTGCGACLEACPTRFQPRYRTQPARFPMAEAEAALVARLVQRHGQGRAALLRVMQDVNEELHYLPRSVVYALAERFSVPVSVLYRIGTFYTAFSFTPRGRHTISACTGTACHIKGAGRLVEGLKRELGVDVGGTTEDRAFTLETVRCLGCCSLAPVLKVGERVYGGVKPAELSGIIRDWRQDRQAS